LEVGPGRNAEWEIEGEEDAFAFAKLTDRRSTRTNIDANWPKKQPKELKMPIQLNEESGGKILVVHVTGKLAKADYEHFVPEFDRLVRQHGKLRVLFDMAGLHGWEASAMWEDLKFGIKHFADIERLAMIGEKKWQQGMATFCKPFTKAIVRYFDHSETAEARAWLAETPKL
jgi:hypothetical protein